MSLIREDKVPWKNINSKNPLLNSKKYFLFDDEINYYFLGIQKYLNQSAKLKFDETPKYDIF